jgi:hypothetical protein
MTMTQTKSRFAVCINSGSYEASLEPRKIYRVLDDPDAEARSLLRVIDESGEDYLFPAELFVPIEVPAGAMPVFATEASGTP